MAISLLSAATRIRDQLTEKSESVAGFSIENIIGQIPTIAERFASLIVHDPKKREYLRPLNPLPATVAAGIADISSLVETSGLLLDFPDYWEVRLSPDTNGYPFQFFQEVSQLDLHRPTDVMYLGFSVEGEKLYFKNTDGDRAADLGDITIAGFVRPIIADDPANSTLSKRLEADFVVYGAGEMLKFIKQGK